MENNKYVGCKSVKCRQCKYYYKFLAVLTMQGICRGEGCFYEEVDDNKTKKGGLVMEERLKELKKVCNVQCSKGNYDFNEYMRGMANGLILAVAIMEGSSDPKYIDPPKDPDNSLVEAEKKEVGIRMIEVKSSNINSVGYNKSSSTLRVMFKAGTFYDYFKVEESKFIELLQAESVGKFFSREIRNIYDYNKVEDLTEIRNNNG